MKSTITTAAITGLVLTAFSASAQYEDNPPKQELWNVFQAAAPYYVALKDCEREDTAQLVWDEMDQAATKLVANEADAKIAFNMWKAARKQTRNQQGRELAYAQENPDSDFCEEMEDATFEALGVQRSE